MVATLPISSDHSSITQITNMPFSSNSTGTAPDLLTGPIVSNIVVDRNTTTAAAASSAKLFAVNSDSDVIALSSTTGNRSMIGINIATETHGLINVTAFGPSDTSKISKIIVTETTVHVSPVRVNLSTTSSPTLATSLHRESYLSGNATTVRPALPTITDPASLPYPSSWYAACSQLSHATYMAPRINGRVNDSEYISSCHAASRAYSLFVGSYNKTFLSWGVTQSVFLESHTSFASLRLNPHTPQGLFTLCDSFTRVNSTNGYFITDYLSTVNTIHGLPSEVVKPFPTCVFNGTTPAYPAPPDCSIPPASCTNIWSSWAETGAWYEIQSLTAGLGGTYTTYAGTTNTPVCDPGDPYFTCKPAGRHSTSVSCGTNTCIIGADKVDIFYWPPKTRGGGLCGGSATTITPTHAQYATITIDTTKVVTITSPTAFISMDKVWAGYYSTFSDFPLPTFPTYYNVTMSILQAELSSVEVRIPGFRGSPQEELECIVAGDACSHPQYGVSAVPFNFADLDGPVPAPTYFFGAYSQGWLYRNLQFGHTAHADIPMDWTIYDDYSARIAVPTQVRDLDPAFQGCITNLIGPIDPPKALSAAGTVSETVTMPKEESMTTVPASPSLTVAPVPSTLASTLPEEVATSSKSAYMVPAASSVAAKSPNFPETKDPSAVLKSTLSHDTDSSTQFSEPDVSTDVRSEFSTAASQDPYVDHDQRVSQTSKNFLSTPPSQALTTASEVIPTGIIKTDPQSDIVSDVLIGIGDFSTLARSDSAKTVAASGFTTNLTPSEPVTDAGQTTQTGKSNGGGASTDSTSLTLQSPSSLADPLETIAVTVNSENAVTVVQEGTSLFLVTGGTTALPDPGLPSVVDPNTISAHHSGGSLNLGTKTVLGGEDHLTFGSTLATDQTVTIGDNSFSFISGHLVAGGSAVSFTQKLSKTDELSVATITFDSGHVLTSQIITTDESGNTFTQDVINGKTFRESQILATGSYAVPVLTEQRIGGSSAILVPTAASPLTQAVGTLAVDSSHVAVEQIVATNAMGQTDTKLVVGGFTLRDGQIATLGGKDVSFVSGHLVDGSSTVELVTATPFPKAFDILILNNSHVSIEQIVTLNTAGRTVTNLILDGSTLSDGQASMLSVEGSPVVSGQLTANSSQTIGSSTLRSGATAQMPSLSSTSNAVKGAAATSAANRSWAGMKRADLKWSATWSTGLFIMGLTLVFYLFR